MKKKEIDKLSYMLKKRDEKISRLEEERKGYWDLLSAMSAYVAYFVLKDGGNARIPKKDIAELLGKYTCRAKEDGESYIISIKRQGGLNGEN